MVSVGGHRSGNTILGCISLGMIRIFSSFLIKYLNLPWSITISPLFRTFRFFTISTSDISLTSRDAYVLRHEIASLNNLFCYIQGRPVEQFRLRMCVLFGCLWMDCAFWNIPREKSKFDIEPLIYRNIQNTNNENLKLIF